MIFQKPLKIHCKLWKDDEDIWTWIEIIHPCHQSMCQLLEPSSRITCQRVATSAREANKKIKLLTVITYIEGNCSCNAIKFGMSTLLQPSPLPIGCAKNPIFSNAAIYYSKMSRDRIWQSSRLKLTLSLNVSSGHLSLELTLPMFA